MDGDEANNKSFLGSFFSGGILDYLKSSANFLPVEKAAKFLVSGSFMNVIAKFEFKGIKLDVIDILTLIQLGVVIESKSEDLLEDFSSTGTNLTPILEKFIALLKQHAAQNSDWASDSAIRQSVLPEFITSTFSDGWGFLVYELACVWSKEVRHFLTFESVLGDKTYDCTPHVALFAGGIGIKSGKTEFLIEISCGDHSKSFRIQIGNPSVAKQISGFRLLQFLKEHLMIDANVSQPFDIKVSISASGKGELSRMKDNIVCEMINDMDWCRSQRYTNETEIIKNILKVT